VNIIYVAMTRAENKLIVATKLAAWLAMCGVEILHTTAPVDAPDEDGILRETTLADRNTKSYASDDDLRGACSQGSSCVYGDPHVTLEAAFAPVVASDDVVAGEMRVHASCATTEPPPQQPPVQSVRLTPWQRIQIPPSASQSSAASALRKRTGVDAERAVLKGAGRRRTKLAPPFA
jgi:hypothetical protein